MVEQAFGSLVTSGITGSEALPNESFDRLEEKRKSSKKNKEHACPGSCTNRSRSRGMSMSRRMSMSMSMSMGVAMYK